MKHSFKKEFRRFLCFLMTFIMILTSMPVHLLAAYDYNDLSNDKSKIINKIENVEVAKPQKGQTAEEFVKDPKQPATYTLRTDYKAEKGEGYKVNYQPYVATVGEAASDAEKAKVNKEIKLPDMAGYDKPVGEEILKIKYDNIVKLAKNGRKTGNEKNGYNFLEIQDKNYKAKVNSVVIKHVFQDMHDFNKFTNRKSDTITEEKTVPKTVNGETTYEKEGWVYKKKADNTFPTDPDGKYDLSDPDQKAEFVKYEETTTDRGNTGSTLEVQALQESERPGFVPQVEKLKTQVPEDTSEFKIEYRYNRAHYNVVFDTQDGTPLPTRSYYYDQEIPKIDENSIPKKTGSEFLGWKPSHDLYGADGTKYKKGEIIKDAKGNAIVDLGNIYYKKDAQGGFEHDHDEQIKEKSQNEIQLKMPALKLGDGKSIPRGKLTFTAVWKDKEKADYAVQFWVEKSDHADNASLMDKYDYMGTRVYPQEPTGKRPDLDNEKPGPVTDLTGKTLPGLKFPDLDKTRLQKIWNGVRFNRGHDLYLNKFFVYNKDLTHDQNKDSEQPTMTKAVSATGKTVYNIYYDRQVYDLYFTKSNKQPEKNTIYPEIWGYDKAKGEAVMLGGPGKPYHYKARFNEMMYKWPNDAKQTKGFTPGYQSFGWGPNYTTPNWPTHLDTPPYRLNADEFLDMANYDSWSGYTKHIDKGDGTTKDLDRFDFTTLSFGIKQDKPSIPHHMDFWMDGFKKGETIIRYDLVRTKADTDSLTYGHKYPIVQGFTPKDYEPNNPQSAWPVIREGNEENGRVKEDGINDLNDERDDITPNTCGTYYNNQGVKLPIGQLDFIPHFFSDADDFDDVKEGGQEFTENGYLQFHYKRNKYPLRFNYDPSIIRDDSYFNETNKLETFYEFPLACLSPELVDKDTPREDREYFKENPQSWIDNPDKLKKMGLTDLVEKDKNGKFKIRRPEGVSEQSEFKGWALDPAGTKLVWKNKGETMPTHPLNVYAKWGEPDYKWKVTIDPNGGTLPIIGVKNLTTEEKTIKEGEGEKEKESTYPVAGYEGNNLPTGDEDKDKSNPQVFTVVQRQKLKDLPKPERYGYDFLGWEVVRYKKDNEGNYTDNVDNEYRTRYKVPELYTFGEDVVSPITLKAIWVENKRADVKVKHIKLTKDFKFDENIYPNPQVNTLEYKRVGDYVPTTGEKQDENWILATHEELMEKLPKDLKDKYIKYNDRVKMNNTFFQTFKVADNKNVGTKEKPVYKPSEDNVFMFFYRPFRTRDYKVNYLDERGKKEVEEFYKGLEPEETTGLSGADKKKKFKENEEKLDAILDKYKLVDQEEVVSQCRHFDARNYRQIPGWKLVSDPQQQLFYDVNEDTNEFLGINGTGGDQIFFYYKDARVIEVPKDGKTPEGYVRVTFKIDDKKKGGVFKDKDGKEVTELHYDVIKGLKSDNLPHPVIWEGGKDDKGNDKVKEENRYYITPDQGKSFKGWDNEKWLNSETEINKNYTFTAYFEWSGLSATGLVRTEAFKDPNGKWTNNFAPTIDQLKKQLVWKEKDQVKDLPAGTEVKLYDEAGNELESDEDVFNLVNEKKAADKDELVRTVNVKAKVTFTNGKEPQELDIPITVYKNVYEALNEKGDKPLFLTKAEKKEAKDGGLKDILKNNTENRYIKVTIKPSKDFKNKDDKVYYVNPNAWVNIPELKVEDSEAAGTGFINWTADKVNQNDDGKKDGKFDFDKRHKFTEDTIITPVDTKDVVEQKDPTKKPDVPKGYVKVIVKTTDKATDDTKFEKTFWVNPTKEVAITVTNPKGKTVAADTTKPGTVGYTMKFSKWESTETTARTWEDKILGQFTAETTIVAKYSVTPEKIKDQVPSSDTVHTPQGKTPTVDQIKEKITPPDGKTIKEVKIVENPDVKNPGESKVKVIVEYTDGSSVGTNDKPIEVPVKVHEPLVKSNPDSSKPEGAMNNYVKVIFKAGTGGSVSGDLVYYVSPEVEVDMTNSAKAITKTPDIGYTANGGTWSPEIKAEKITAEKTYEFNFKKSDDIVEKTGDNVKKPDGYVEVIFKTEDKAKGKLDVDKLVKIYYVNPKAEIKLVELTGEQKASEKQLAVPKTSPATNYEFDKWYEEIDTETAITSERIHVAKFKLAKVTLTYEAGEGAKGEVPAKVEVDHGTSVRLASAEKLSKDNATFAGWKLDDDDKIYQPGEQVKLEKARTATAQWTSTKHTVTFDTKGGSEVPSKQVVHEGKLAKVDNPTLKDKVFIGWKEKGKENEKDYFDFKTPITEDKTLIAQWTNAVQEINDGDTIDTEKFIKVTFNEGKHGKLKLADQEQTSPLTYKVAKDLSYEDAVKAGLKVPKIDPAKYYKAKTENDGWDKALDLALAAGEIEKIFTAQYEPQADVIPVDPNVTEEEQIQKEKPEGMVLVTFVVPEDKAFMTGETRFYVKKNQVVDIDTPVVHPLTLDDDKENDYEFKGWKFNKDSEGNYVFSFDEDTQIDDGNVTKPEIEIRNPRPNLKNIVISKLTDGATGYLEVTRGSNPPVLVESTKRGRFNIFVIPSELGGKLNRNDTVKIYSKLDNLVSDKREYRVR